MADSHHAAVVGVAVLGDHRLRLLFDEGTVGDVDFSQEDWKGVLEPLRNAAYFATVRVDLERGRSPGPMEKTSRPSLCTRGLELAH